MHQNPPNRAHSNLRPLVLFYHRPQLPGKPTRSVMRVRTTVQKWTLAPLVMSVGATQFDRVCVVVYCERKEKKVEQERLW